MEFRPLTDIEIRILRRLLTVEHPLYIGLLDQLPKLLALPVSDWGTIALSVPEGTLVKTRKMCGSLPYLGVMKDSDGVPVQFAVFVDKDDQLCELEITKLDGSPVQRKIVPEEIVLKMDKPGTDLG
jgi:hypothetical protein